MLRISQYKNTNDMCGQDLFFITWNGEITSFPRYNGTTGYASIDFSNQFKDSYTKIWGD